MKTLPMSLFFAFLAVYGSLASGADRSLLKRPGFYDTRPHFAEATLKFGAVNTRDAFQSDNVRVYIWNVHKGLDSTLPADFKTTSDGVDLALFQEAVSQTSFMPNIAWANPELAWTLAKSFQWRSAFTGVATGSRVKPINDEVIVSDPSEPLSLTHKTILISEFKVADRRESLLVANIHAINFVDLNAFKENIRQLVERAKLHVGPMIVAGDFNSWSKERTQTLQEALTTLNMTWVKTPPNRFLNLDHVFVRGFIVKGVYKLNQLRSSDHTPLVVDLAFEPNQLN